jgi:hypothetical protein
LSRRVRATLLARRALSPIRGFPQHEILMRMRNLASLFAIVALAFPLISWLMTPFAG